MFDWELEFWLCRIDRISWTQKIQVPRSNRMHRSIYIRLSQCAISSHIGSMKGSSCSLHSGAFREAQGSRQWEGDDTPKTVIYYVTVIDAFGGGCRLRELTAFRGLNAFKSSETTNLGHVWRANGAVAVTDATIICCRLPPALINFSLAKAIKAIDQRL